VSGAVGFVCVKLQRFSIYNCDINKIIPFCIFVLRRQYLNFLNNLQILNYTPISILNIIIQP